MSNDHAAAAVTTAIKTTSASARRKTKRKFAIIESELRKVDLTVSLIINDTDSPAHGMRLAFVSVGHGVLYISSRPNDKDIVTVPWDQADDSLLEAAEHALPLFVKHALLQVGHLADFTYEKSLQVSRGILALDRINVRAFGLRAVIKNRGRALRAMARAKRIGDGHGDAEAARAVPRGR